MPGIKLFNRRWTIGSDDLVFPSFAEICLRLLWLIILSIILQIHHESFGCPNGNLLHNYYIGAIVLLSIGILHTTFIMYVSMGGSIRNGYPRRHMQMLLYIKFCILLPEAVWICVATYWAFGYSYSCDWTIYWTVRGAIICAWIVGLGMFVGIILAFDPLGSSKQDDRISLTKQGSKFFISPSMSHNVRAWEWRCRCLCCCIANSQDTNEAFADVSKVVAEFFKDTDLVPTDIAAGLILVEQQQINRERSLSTVVTDTAWSRIQSGLPALSIETADISQHGNAGINGSGQKSWMTLPKMAHYMKFALGSYGWPFYMFSNLTFGLCKLCLQFRCCACVRGENQVYLDNICQCHTAAIRSLTQVCDQDLLYVSFHNKYREVPFYVAFDHVYNALVISIRGTLSVQDILTDISARGVPLDIEGVPEAYCHDAMLDCATYIRSKLEQERRKRPLLDQYFHSLQEGCPLVIVGHSLGAGVAALLAVLLRPQYPNLICFAYSPPGGLMSTNASKYVRDFVCSVVVGEDIVPRLGMPTMYDLKIKLLRALCECDTPKYRILATGCMRLLCSCFTTSQKKVNAQLMRQAQKHYSSCGQLESSSDPLQEALKTAEECAKEVQAGWPSQLPGQILHITEVQPSSVRGLCGGSPLYSAVWAQPEDFSHIIISRKMILDHFPDVVLNALCQLSDRSYIPQARPFDDERTEPKLAGCLS